MMKPLDPFKPRLQALALEPRILFDGAAAVAVEQQLPQDDGQPSEAEPVEAAHPAPDSSAAPRTLLVIDKRIEDAEALAAQAAPGVHVLVVEADENGLAAITDALAQMGSASSVQILSHGSSGQFSLGASEVSADTADNFSATLQQWRGFLSEGADVQLHGCNIGAGEAGHTLVTRLAQLTGADVGASDDDTGSAAAGGDWELEVTSGEMDRSLALTGAALASFDGLLADADPVLSLDSASSEVLIGEQFAFTVNFENGSSQVGFAPFIDLFFPATGKDGAGEEVDDGITFISASYLGQMLNAHVLTFDASGQAAHPLARDAGGNPVIVNAADFGMQAGDQLVVVELPYASVSDGQPVIPITVTAQVSELADTRGAPDLTIKARGGFEYGNDALDNPEADPSLLGTAAGAQSFVVTPTVITLTAGVSAPEGETATGPNYSRTLTITATPASGQTISNATITQALPANIQVTAITPGAGGTLTSITLANGVTVTNPGRIQDFIELEDVFVTEFTIHYEDISAAAVTTVEFYIPETDADGNVIVDPSTGDAVTINIPAATGVGDWVPLDERDVDDAGTFSGTGEPASVVAKSITLRKEVSIEVDAGVGGVTPGDTLRYTLHMDLSDYFGFGETFFEDGSFTITDTLGDGQTLAGSAVLTIFRNGTSQNITLVAASTPNGDGTTSLTLDLAQSLRDAGFTIGALFGDLANDSTLAGATGAIISYAATVDQAYATAYPPHSEINEGDSIGNDATVTATVLEDSLNLTGNSESDTSSSSSTVPVSGVDISVFEVNGGAPPANGELQPGDLVTFRLAYDLVTGDYENFSLTAYMPLPLFDLAGITWSQGGGAGQWDFGAGNTNGDTSVAVSTAGANSILFDFGDYAVNSASGSRIEIDVTLEVGDQPYADNRSFSVLAQSSQQTTITDVQLVSSDVALISSIAEPVLSMTHGVVSSSGGTVSGTSGTWQAPGTSGVPFSGSVTDLAAIEGSVAGIDGGDLLRLATAIENTGGGGAFNVITSIALPAGFSFSGGSLSLANLQLYRGDGTLLVAGQDYGVSGTTITFLDNGGVASLLPGRSGTAEDASGQNVVVITYDVVADSAIAASSTLQSTATLSNYSSVDGGTDFTVTDQTDTADQQVAAPSVRKAFADGSIDAGDSSAAHTSGTDLVVGETMLYDIVVTLPEGTTQSLRLEDLIPSGLALDTSFGSGGYELITTAAGSGLLSSDFAGTVTVGSLAAVSGTLGDNGVDARFSFSAAVAAADNDTGNNSFIIRVRLVADNVASNQAGAARFNDAQLRYSDPDGDAPNGAAPQERVVALDGDRPSVTVREPTLTIGQTLVTAPGRGFDEGDTVEFTITISNGGGSSDFDAFDITFSDALPTEFDGLTLTNVVYAGGATNNGGADFEISGGVLQSVAGANIDIGKGGSIVLTVTGVVNATGASVGSFDNVAEVRWTSLDGTVGGAADPAGERTGEDGLGGALDDYARSSTLTIPIAQGIKVSRVGGLPDTAAADPTNAEDEPVTIGEILRYRVLVLIPEGNNPNYQLQIILDDGLEFIDPASNEMRIALVSNGGLTSSIMLVTGGTLAVTGDENSEIAQDIPANLSGAAPTGVLDPALVSIGALSGGQRIVTIDMGDLTNAEAGGSDSDLEGIVLEFNVRVSNIAGNSSGDQLGVTVQEVVNGTPRAESDTLFQDIVEPGFNSLTKQVIAFDPNVGGTTGTATVSLSFTQNGGVAAFNAQLSDSFPTGSNYSLVSITLGGTAYAPGSLPAGISFSEAGGLSVDFDQIDPGTAVSVVYTVDVPNAAAIASANATLTWTSLPEDFTSWGGNDVGTDGAADGERTGSGAAPNTYVLSEGAGLGVISGTLWNDTQSADGSAVPDGPGLEGQTVTLTWGGLDGSLATTDDNVQFTATTDVNGDYLFGVLAAGTYRIDTPSGTITYAQPVGDLRPRIDTDGGTLAQITISLGEGATDAANAGYVEQNDAPVHTLPGVPASGDEDTDIPITGISIADVDSDRDPNAADRQLDVTISVLSGVLSLSSDPDGVIQGGSNGTAALRLIGTLSELNDALTRLVYRGNQDFNGTDTLTITTNDLGNFGDADGDGTPGESADDALADSDTLQIIVNPVNDPPSAVDDAATAVEAGGPDNGTPGVNPGGNLLANDTDVDIATNGDVLVVTRAESDETADSAVTPVAGFVSITGRYGTLVFDATGLYEYVVDNENAEVQALRQSGDTLQESFTYTMRDSGGVQDSATFTVTIQGANDNPVAVNDTGNAAEAGGVANGTAGTDAAGNVLANDTDPDGGAGGPIDYGETQTVTGIRAVREDDPGSVTTVSGSTPIAGQYGTLTINPDGSYSYVIDNSSAAVQALSAGETLDDYFSYVVTDAGGLNDIGELRIVINGANDNPVATDNVADAQAALSTLPDTDAAESNPSGNVITNDTGAGQDSDVDAADQPNTNLTVTGIRTGTEGAGGALTGVAAGGGEVAVLSANGYGTLYIQSDGSARYNVDSTNAAVVALGMGATLTDTFTYEVSDTSGLTDLAQITITIYGINDAPVAQDAFAVAVEAGGVNNGTPGSDGTGDVTLRDFDPEGEPLTVTAIRTGPEGGAGTAGAIGAPIAGTYGSLTLNADGTFTYVVDNDDPAVQALRRANDTLTERFTYTIEDGDGLQDQAEIIVLIRGQNDTPAGVDDTATAVESGGSNNNVPGSDPVGNVLDNDRDADGGEDAGDPVDYGETREVSAFANAGGDAGTLGSELRGTYGWLLLNADGSYTYRVDNSLAAVQALRTAADTLSDTFSYTLRDAAGAVDAANLTVAIQGANDTPAAADDSAVAVEAGGVNNGTAGVDPTGNVLANDTDVDSAANGETKTVVSFRQGGLPSGAGTTLAGTYGTLTLNADGSYVYAVNNDLPAVQALRNGQTLTESFTYTMRDQGGLSSSALLTVTVQGRNDNPVAVNDAATAVEAGGTANAVPGTDPSGNVLANDTDVDSGESRSVTGVRTGAEAAGGVFLPVSGARSVIGLYGTLTLNADGSYTYVVDNSLAAVQALQAGQSLTEFFTYRVADLDGAIDAAELAITIEGAWDAPVGVNNANLALAQNANGGSFNPTGNVLTNDTDVDAGDGKAVSGIRAGAEASGGVLAAVTAGTDNTNGTVIAGTYGTLTIGADGTYRYAVNSSHPDLIALPALAHVTEVFTYEVTDLGGLTDLAQLTILVFGRNEAPVAVDDSNVASDQVLAPEAIGDVLPNDFDDDDDELLEVTAIRTGGEGEAGTAGVLGQALQGKYGTLTLNGDGSYTYTIDRSNPDVLAAAGLGQVLQDVFTYTITDTWGATDQAELVINLDIAQPYVPPPDPDEMGAGPWQAFEPDDGSNAVNDLGVDPVVFISPIVETNARLNDVLGWQTDGSDLTLTLPAFIRSQSIGAGLGNIDGLFVGNSVFQSRFDSELDLAWFLGREGRISLTADGIFEDPSLFSGPINEMADAGMQTGGETKVASSFRSQLQEAERKFRPQSRV